MNYELLLKNKIIGTTILEYADPSMGVVGGKIIFNNISSPYKFLSDYCKENNIKVNEDDLSNKWISTQDIPELIVKSINGTIIKGQATCILGFNEDGFQIEIIGIPHPEYDKLFPEYSHK